MPTKLLRTVNGWSFERPLALLLAAAAAFAALAAPLQVGTLAHLAIALVLAAGLGHAGYAAMRRAGRPRVRAVDPAEEEGDPAFAPGEVPVRLRRADRHPDAPARAPIFASRDLGSPFMEVGAFAPPPEPAPVHDAEFAEIAAEVTPEVEAEPVREPEPEPVEWEAVAAAEADDTDKGDTPEHREPEQDEPDHVAAAEMVEPASSDPVEVAAPPEPEPEDSSVVALDAFRPAEMPFPMPARAARPSLDAMMERLASGLERRGGSARGLPAALEDALAARRGRPELREALEELNRLAGRRH